MSWAGVHSCSAQLGDSQQWNSAHQTEMESYNNHPQYAMLLHAEKVIIDKIFHPQSLQIIDREACKLSSTQTTPSHHINLYYSDKCHQKSRYT